MGGASCSGLTAVGIGAPQVRQNGSLPEIVRPQPVQ